MAVKATSDQDYTAIEQLNTMVGPAVISRDRLIVEQAEVQTACSKIWDYLTEVELLLHRMQLKAPYMYSNHQDLLNFESLWSTFRAGGAIGAMHILGISENARGT